MANMKVIEPIDIELAIGHISNKALENGLTNRVLSEVQKVAGFKTVISPPVDIELNNIKFKKSGLTPQQILQQAGLPDIMAVINRAMEKQVNGGESILDKVLTGGAGAERVKAVISQMSALNNTNQALLSNAHAGNAAIAKDFADGRTALHQMSREQINGGKEFLTVLQGQTEQLKIMRNIAGKRSEFVPKEVLKESFDARKQLSLAKFAYYGALTKGQGERTDTEHTDNIKRLKDDVRARDLVAKQAKAKVEAIRVENDPTYSPFLQNLINEFTHMERKLKGLFEESHINNSAKVKSVLQATNELEHAKSKSEADLSKYLADKEAQIRAVKAVLDGKNLHTSDSHALEARLRVLRELQGEASNLYAPFAQETKNLENYGKSVVRRRQLRGMKVNDKFDETKDNYQISKDYVDSRDLNKLSDNAKKDVLKQVSQSMSGQALKLKEKVLLTPDRLLIYEDNNRNFLSLREKVLGTLGKTATNPWLASFDTQSEAAQRKVGEANLPKRIRSAVESGSFDGLNKEEVNKAIKQYAKQRTILGNLHDNKSYDDVAGAEHLKTRLAQTDKILEGLNSRKEQLPQLSKLGVAEKQADRLLNKLPKLQQLLVGLNRLSVEDLQLEKQRLSGRGYRVTPAQKDLLSPARQDDVDKAHQAVRDLRQAIDTTIKSKTPASAGSTSPSAAARNAAISEGQRLAQQGVTASSATVAQNKAMQNYHEYEVQQARIQQDRAFKVNNTADYAQATQAIEHHTNAHRELQKSLKETRSMMGMLGHAFQTLSAYGGVAQIIYGVAGAIKEVIGSVINLEDEMKNIQAITSASDSEMATIGQAIKDTATTTAFSIKEISEAVKTVAQAGVDMKDIPKTVQAIADVATATSSQLQVAADILTTVKNVWSDVDVGAIGDRITQAANVSKLAVADLQTILSLNASAAKAANVSLEQSLSLDALLKNAGVRSSTIATGSTTLYRELFSPDKKFSEFLSRQYSRNDEKVSAEEATKRFSDYRLAENPLVAAISELKRIGVGDHKSVTELERALDSRALNVFKPLLSSKESLQSLEAQMRAGASASEGAAIASKTVKKSFENLGDQVEILAEVMGEPMLEPLRKFVNFLNHKVIQPVSERAELGNLAREQEDRAYERKRENGEISLIDQIQHNLVQWDRSLRPSDFSGLRDQKDSADVSLTSLLAQQAHKQKEFDKELESLKAYSDAPDSLRTTYEKRREGYESFNASLLETFGGKASKEDLSKVLRLLSEVSTTPEKQRANALNQVKKLTGGVRVPTTEEVQEIANEAEAIQASFDGMIKAYKSRFIQLVELGEDKNEAQKKELDALKRLRDNKDLSSAVFNGGKLDAGKQIEVIDQYNAELIKAFDEANAKNAKFQIDKITEQLVSAEKTPGKDKKDAALQAVLDKLTETLQEGSINKAESVKEGVLKALKDHTGLSDAERGDIANSLDPVLDNVSKEMASLLALKLQAASEQLNEGIKALQLVPDKSPNEQATLSRLESSATLLQYGAKLKEIAKLPGMQVTAEEGLATVLRESGGRKDAKNTDSPGNTAEGLTQQTEAARFETYKKYADKFPFKTKIPANFTSNGKTFTGYTYDPTNAEDSLLAGMLQLNEAKKATGDAVEAQSMYHLGPTGYANFKLGKPLAPEVAKEEEGVRASFPDFLATARTLLAGKVVDEKGNLSGTSTKDINKALTSGRGVSEKVYKSYEEANALAIRERDSRVAEATRKLNNLSGNDADATKSIPLVEQINAEKQAGLSERLTWVRDTQQPDKDKRKEEWDKERTLRITEVQAAIQEQQTAYEKQIKGLRDILDPKIFNESSVEIISLRKDRTKLQGELSDLDTPESIKKLGKAETDRQKIEKVRAISRNEDIESQKKLDYLENVKTYAPDQLKKNNNVKAQEIAVVSAEIERRQKETARAVNAISGKAILQEAEDLLKSIEKEVEANALELKAAQTAGDLAKFRVLKTKQGALADKQDKALLDRIEKDPAITEPAKALEEQKIKNKRNKAALGDVSAYNQVMDSRFRLNTTEGIEAFSARGVQEALGQSPSISYLRDKNAQDLAAYQDRLINYNQDKRDFTATGDSTIDSEVLRNFDEKIKEATQNISRLSVEAQNLAPTLESELGQISTDNLVSEIDNLNGSMRNLDKNLSQRIVQAIDKFSTDIADSAITAAKGLLGFNTATKEATDALLNLADKQGDLALVQTNRVDLAEKIQSVRMNESDPARQEELIKQATDAQNRAEQLAQAQVDEAQKAKDKVAYDESFAGKAQNTVKDLVTGAASDVIKSQVLSLFSGKPDGSASNPIYTKSVDGVVTASSPGILNGVGRLAEKAWNGVTGLFDSSTPTVIDQGNGVTTSPIDTSSFYQPVTPIGDVSLAQGGGEIPTAVEGGSKLGVEAGFDAIKDDQKSVFSEFTDSLKSENGSFLATLGATLMMSSGASGQKKGVLDYIQMGLGVLSMGLGAAGKMGAFSSGTGTGTIDMAKTSFDGPVIYKETGGFITGPGTATSDDIPAMLSNGEYVLNAKTVAKICKGTLDAWNFEQAHPIKRATGGAVGNLQPQSFSAQQPAQPVVQSAPDTNIRVVMVDDQRRVGDFINSSEGEKVLVDFMRRNSTSMKQVLK